MASDLTDVDRPVADLVEELRTTVTPVLGYLELIADDDPGALSAEQQRWLRTVEERLAALRSVSGELIAACARLRDLSADREAPGLGSEARLD